MKKKYPIKAAANKRITKLKDADALYPMHSDSVMFRIDESLISTLIDLNTGKYFSLNFLGTLIWRLADGTRTSSEIKEALAQRFPLKSKSADYIDKFLKQLTKNGFIIQSGSKVKGINPSDVLKSIPKGTSFTLPKMISTKPEPLNVFGMPGPGGY